MSIAKDNTFKNFETIVDRVEALCDNLSDEDSTPVTSFYQDLAEELGTKLPVVQAIGKAYLSHRDDMEVVKGPQGGLRRKTAARLAAREAAVAKVANLETKRAERAARKAEKDAKRAAKKAAGSANAFAKPAEENGAVELAVPEFQG